MPPKLSRDVSDVRVMQRNLEIFFEVLRYVSGHPVSASPRLPPAVATATAAGEGSMSPCSSPQGHLAEPSGTVPGNFSFSLQPGSVSQTLSPRPQRQQPPPHPWTPTAASQQQQQSQGDVAPSTSAVSHLTCTSAHALMNLPSATAAQQRHDHNRPEALPSVTSSVQAASSKVPTTMSPACLTTTAVGPSASSCPGVQVSSSSYTSATSLSGINRTGASTSSVNRVQIPSAFDQELENFRMVSTNLPLDRAAVKASKAALRRGMLSFYGAKAERRAVRDMFRRKSRRRRHGKAGTAAASTHHVSSTSGAATQPTPPITAVPAAEPERGVGKGVQDQSGGNSGGEKQATPKRELGAGGEGRRRPVVSKPHGSPTGTAASVQGRARISATPSAAADVPKVVAAHKPLRAGVAKQALNGGGKPQAGVSQYSLPVYQRLSLVAGSRLESDSFLHKVSTDENSTGPDSDLRHAPFLREGKPVKRATLSGGSRLRHRSREDARSGSERLDESGGSGSRQSSSLQYSLCAESPLDGSAATTRYMSDTFSSLQRSLTASGGVAQSNFGRHSYSSPKSSGGDDPGNATVAMSAAGRSTSDTRSVSTASPAQITASNSMETGATIATPTTATMATPTTTTSGEQQASRSASQQHQAGRGRPGSSPPRRSLVVERPLAPALGQCSESSSGLYAVAPMNADAGKASNDFQEQIARRDQQPQPPPFHSGSGPSGQEKEVDTSEGVWAVHSPTLVKAARGSDTDSTTTTTTSTTSSESDSDGETSASSSSEEKGGAEAESSGVRRLAHRGRGPNAPRRRGVKTRATAAARASKAGNNPEPLTSVESLKSMQEIIPGLWCGSYVPATNKEFLKSKGITHICCCIDVGRFPFPEDFMYMKVPVMDTVDADISAFFSRTFEFIENALIKQRGAVLVHCGAGISRAPTVTAAYLIRKLRLSAAAAIALIQERRPFASPNAGFRRQLRAYTEKMKIAHLDAVREAELLQETDRAAIKAIHFANDGKLDKSGSEGEGGGGGGGARDGKSEGGQASAPHADVLDDDAIVTCRIKEAMAAAAAAAVAATPVASGGGAQITKKDKHDL